MKHILDRNFEYTPAVSTDVAKTIRRVIKQREQAAKVSAACEPWFDASAFERAPNVRSLPNRHRVPV